MAEVAGEAGSHKFDVRIIHSKKSTEVVASGLQELVDNAKTTLLTEHSYNAVRIFWFLNADSSDVNEKREIKLNTDRLDSAVFTTIIDVGLSTIFAWNKDESPKNTPQSSPPEPSGGSESRHADLADVASHPQFLAERAAKEQAELRAEEEKRRADAAEHGRQVAYELAKKAQRSAPSAAADDQRRGSESSAAVGSAGSCKGSQSSGTSGIRTDNESCDSTEWNEAIANNSGHTIDTGRPEAPAVGAARPEVDRAKELEKGTIRLDSDSPERD